LGTTGGGDRLLIVYDSDRLDLVRQFELDHIKPTVWPAFVPR
jgi:hypothetical protein